MRRFLFAVALVFASAGVLFADHPNDARGFAADRVYSIHDVDTVNPFNGNLNIRAFRVGA